MINDNIYYSKQQNFYYIKDISITCDECNALLCEQQGFSIFMRQVGIAYDRIVIYCGTCAERLKDSGLLNYSIQNYAIVSEIIPEDSLPVLRERMGLKNGRDSDIYFTTASGISNFDTESVRRLGGTVIDKTKFANRPDNNNALNSPEDIKHLIDDKDKILNRKEIISLVEDLGKAQPYKEDSLE